MWRVALAVDQKQVVGAGAPGDIDVFAQLDVALGAEDRAAPVTPRGQAVGRVPVDADVAVAAVAAQQDLAEVLELGLVRIGVVGDRARDDLGVVGAGEVEELIDLVRADVGQDAAALGADRRTSRGAGGD